MSTVSLLDAQASADLVDDDDKWVFLNRPDCRRLGLVGAVRALRSRAQDSRPTLELAEVPEYGSGDPELADDMQQSWR